MIQVKVDQLVLSNKGFVVLLKGDSDTRSLPIFIGAAEAQAIHIHLNNMTAPRPLTHDLCKNVLDFLECRLMRVEVCDLKDGTFYAVLDLERDGSRMRIDARPSDAIALALRCAAPIFVAKNVMDEAGHVFGEEGKEEAGDARTLKSKKATKLSPLEELKRDIEKAVSDERFEDAARIRDAIKRIEKTHSGN